ncbi:MAG: hypothetical protein WC823_01095 [Parcubacteria group bacterium]|jgi:hypothetical protein
MKKISLLIIFGVMLCMTQTAGAATFPVVKEATVTADSNGNITVNAPGESGWVLKQYCQDNLRAGCGNDQTIRPTEDAGGVMRFHLDEGGVASGQVAFNFRNTKLQNKWLAIPDCRVKPMGLVAMGDSKYTSTIPESGGALFVYTGSGREVEFPIDLSGCDQASVSVSQNVTTGTSAKTGTDNGGQSQSVIKSPDSQNVQTKQSARQETHVKGDNNVVKKKIIQQSSTITNRGATVNVKGNVTGKECQDVSDSNKKCVPGIDASTVNFSLVTFGEGKTTSETNKGINIKKDCVKMVDGKVSYDCDDATKTTTTTTTGTVSTDADAKSLKEVKK